MCVDLRTKTDLHYREWFGNQSDDKRLRYVSYLLQVYYTIRRSGALRGYFH